MATIVQGDLLKSNEDFIVHQTNCVTKYAKGLSKVIFFKYPESDVYTPRRISNSKDTPGKIKVCGKIINLFGQLYPGRPKYPNDSTQLRQQWFQTCLEEISDIDGISSVAFPYKIGCGLAGGNWTNYLNMINDWAHSNPHINVVIYKLTV